MKDQEREVRKIPFGVRVFRQRYLLVMAGAGALWMFVFNYLPIAGISIAFTHYNILRPIWDASWAGFEYFIEFFQDERFFLILKNTLGISFFKLLVGFPIPVVFAILLNELRNQKFKRTIQTLSYLPHFLSWVILGGIMINWMSESGLVNELLVKRWEILDEPIVFLAEERFFWGIAVGSDIWKSIGWNAIIYIAAIAGVNPNLYEAAYMDGASRLQRIVHITLPAIKPTIVILFVLSVAHMLDNNFDQIFVLRNSLNSDASDVIQIYAYKMGIQQARFSFAAAIGVSRAFAMLILLLIANFLSRKFTGEGIY